METGEINTMLMRFSKADLVHEIEEAWANLHDAIDRFTDEEMAEIRDPAGWSMKDHLTHLAAWERSVVLFLQGRPRHEGLGVDEQIYLRGNDDEINAVIQEKHKGVTLSDALVELDEVHSALLRLIEPMSDFDLHKANSDYQPAGSGVRDERPISGMIYSNTANHFRDHQEWMENLVLQSRQEQGR